MQHGVGAYAFIVVKDGDIVHSYARLVTDSTNNRCEYLGIFNAIEWFGANLTVDPLVDKVEIVSDSQLVIKQITGQWKVNDDELLRLKARVVMVGKRVFGSCDVWFTWNSRESEFTKRCDGMCDAVIDCYLRQGG